MDDNNLVHIKWCCRYRTPRDVKALEQFIEIAVA